MSKKILFLAMFLSACSDNIYYIYQFDSGVQDDASQQMIDSSVDEDSSVLDAADNVGTDCECSEGYCCDGCHLIKGSVVISEYKNGCEYPVGQGGIYLSTINPTSYSEETETYFSSDCSENGYYYKNDDKIFFQTNDSHSDPEIRDAESIIYSQTIIKYALQCSCNGSSAWPISLCDSYDVQTIESCDYEHGYFCAQKPFSEIDSEPRCTNVCDPWNEISDGGVDDASVTD